MFLGGLGNEVQHDILGKTPVPFHDGGEQVGPPGSGYR